MSGPEFTFDAGSHVYRVDGRVVPGCTRILDHTGLADYRNVRQDILDQTSDLGSRVHAYCHFYDEDDLDWDDLSDEERPRVQAWASFRRDLGFKPRMREYQMIAEVDGMRYGMRIDREGLVNRKPAVVEIKCTSRIMWHHGVQLAAHAAGLPMDGFIGPMAKFLRRLRYVVQLLPTGKYLMREFSELADYHTFHAALYLTHRKLSQGIELQDLNKENDENGREAGCVSEPVSGNT